MFLFKKNNKNLTCQKGRKWYQGINLGHLFIIGKARRMKDLEFIILNLLFYYIIEQEAITHGIKISRRVEPILITRQENVILLKAKPTMAKGVLMAVRVRYNEPRVNHQDENIVNGVPRIGVEEFIV
jgi:hypothetical protein